MTPVCKTMILLTFQKQDKFFLVFYIYFEFSMSLIPSVK